MWWSGLGLGLGLGLRRMSGRWLKGGGSSGAVTLKEKRDPAPPGLLLAYTADTSSLGLPPQAVTPPPHIRWACQTEIRHFPPPLTPPATRSCWGRSLQTASAGGVSCPHAQGSHPGIRPIPHAPLAGVMPVLPPPPPAMTSAAGSR